MKKVFVAMMMLAFLASMGWGGAYAAGPMSQSMGLQEMSKLVGDEVKNTQGETLGKLNDFVVSNQCQIAYAVITPSGENRKVAVPFDALTYFPEEQAFTMNASKEKLASAPTFTTAADLARSSQADKVHRYFGQRPAWTEEQRETRGFSIPPEVEYPMGPPGGEPGGP